MKLLAGEVVSGPRAAGTSLRQTPCGTDAVFNLGGVHCQHSVCGHDLSAHHDAANQNTHPQDAGVATSGYKNLQSA